MIILLEEIICYQTGGAGDRTTDGVASGQPSPSPEPHLAVYIMAFLRSYHES